MTTIEIKSDKGSQVIEVIKTSFGVTIKTTDVKHHRKNAMHIFNECVPQLIKALENLQTDTQYQTTGDSK